MLFKDFIVTEINSVVATEEGNLSIDFHYRDITELLSQIVYEMGEGLEYSNEGILEVVSDILKGKEK